MRTAVLTLVVTFGITTIGYAQPFPNAVQVCVNGEKGWVPSSHPLATSHPCTVMSAPDPSAPFITLAKPFERFEAGNVYRHIPYGYIWVIRSVTLTERFNYERGVRETTGRLDIIQYQNLEFYQRRLWAFIVDDAGDPFNTMAWELLERK